ncbi:hypothetical protein O9X98_00485 [Agrobacterium salinitolerans]|nr:hypothetical protein [Agrobacterium salinitolerans]
MKDVSGGMIGSAGAAIYLGTEIAFRLIDVLVAKGVLSKAEARSTHYAIAEGIRRDADEHPAAREMVEAVATMLENAGDNYLPRDPETNR